MIRFHFLLAAAFLGYFSVVRAQNGIGDALVFTGVTTTSGSETHAWLAWHPTNPKLLQNRVVALYRKNGSATSTAAFARISIIEPASDTRLVSSLLPAAQKVGQDLDGLTLMLDDLLRDANPAPTLTVAQKITTLVGAAQGDEEGTLRLYTLALQHPAIALAAGIAHADLLPSAGPFTYELRDFDKTGGSDLGVIGRVTVDPAAPLILPAPGPPVEIHDLSPKGNLNASLRWATPNTLRDLAPLHHGFNLYRVPKPIAELNNWHLAPPASATTLVTHPASTLVNRFPILPKLMLTQAEAANAADTTSVFAVDDNGRFLPDGTSFSDGQNYYYFVAARDILGRPGLPSSGTLVSIRDRLAPNPPRNTRVRSVATYNGTVRDQRFVIDWDPPELPTGETISAWYVYRWRTPGQIPKLANQLDPVEGKPERNLIAILPVGTRTFTDNGTTPPPPWAIVDEPAPDNADKGKTYFYTVRAADGSVGKNLSGNSAPAWGVLRDRIGTVGTEGTVLVASFSPTLSFSGYTQVPLAGLPDDRSNLLLTCESTLARGLDWAEWSYLPNGIGGPREVIGRTRFRRNPAGHLVAALRRTVSIFNSEGLECRVGTTAGVMQAVSSHPASLPSPQPGKFVLGQWTVSLTPGGGEGSAFGWRHETTNPVTGETTDVSGAFAAPADAKEFRMYRRVDDGVQTLVAQGETGLSPTVWTDPAPLAASAKVEYFLQTLDANSNAGLLVRQGEPITVVSGFPTPMLSPLTSLLPLTNPKLRVRWFCNTAGVERFEIWVARKSGKAPSSTGSGLSDDLASHPNMDTSLGETAGLDFAVFQTGVARYLNSDGTPEFDVVLPVSLSETYTVMVRAVGTGEYSARAVGAFSNAETSAYSLRAAGANQPVPWPDRPLPPRAEFHPGIEATMLRSDALAPWIGNAVRIGEYADSGYSDRTAIFGDDEHDEQLNFIVTGSRSPDFYLYVNDAVAVAEPKETIPGCILPVALYRVQVANSQFPTVSGDIVQVSPLLEQIAYRPSQAGEVYVPDPFVAFLHEDEADLPRWFSPSDHDVFLLDRQPIIKGARYKYLLVRFTPGREIDRVIVTNTVDVPLHPPLVEPVELPK